MGLFGSNDKDSGKPSKHVAECKKCDRKIADDKASVVHTEATIHGRNAHGDGHRGNFTWTSR
jgi:hypothetical protein